MGRHRWTDRSGGNHTPPGTREKPKWERIKGGNRNKGFTQFHPQVSSLYLGLRLQGQKGTRTPGSWGEGGAGVLPPQGLLPPPPPQS